MTVNLTEEQLRIHACGDLSGVDARLGWKGKEPIYKKP